MIRVISAVLFVIVFLICSIPIWLVMSVLSLFTHKSYDIASLRIVQWAFSVVYHIAGVRVETHGTENIPTDRAVVYIGNHTGIFDVITCYALVPARTGFISKKEWKKIPLLGVWMKRLYCIFLDRESTRDGLNMILQAIEYVKQGISIFIYPEGTRSRDGRLHVFHPGSFKIATKTDCPIVPVAISGSSAIFEEHKPFLRPGRVEITYGRPIVPSELSAEDKKHISEYVHDIIESMLGDKDASAAG